MFIVRGRAARDKRLNCPQSAELTSHVESVRPLSDEKILIGPPTHSRRRRDGQHRSGGRADGGAGPSDPGEWSCPYRATGPGAPQDRQADQDLGRSRTPGHTDGPGNLTRAGIAIRDACAGTEIPSLRAVRSGG